MKIPTGNYTNTEVTTGRTLGAAKNNPGDNTGTGADKEIFNDNIYGHLAVIESYKEGGNSDADETLLTSDTRDAIEELVSKKVSGVDEWDTTITYSAPQLVMYKGFQFFGYNTTGNLAKPPLSSPDYWIKSPSPEILLNMFFEGDPHKGGMNNIANRSHANYKQDSLIGSYRLGGNGDTFYNFYRIALDGTIITGDANLEAIFDVGGSNEYFAIDKYAPDSAGTRTLVDMGAVHDVGQTSGGENDTIAEELENRMQGHQQYIRTDDGRATTGAGVFGSYITVTTNTASGDAVDANSFKTGEFITDGTNGTPRTGSTTRPNEFTRGIDYIIVMIPV